MKSKIFTKLSLNLTFGQGSCLISGNWFCKAKLKKSRIEPNFPKVRGPEAKNSPLFLWLNFNDFIEREPCTKFRDALIRSRKVMK